MRIEVHVHIHNHSTALEVKIDRILHLQERIMSVVDDLKQELVAINAATNEIASDVTALLAKVTDGGVSAADAAELKTSLVAIRERLTGVAAQYTPESAGDGGGDVVDPPIEG
jgi:thiamine biosynthesis lipoprotein ApbE